uniref:Uncharacterized protein n=1 Tax=Lotharella globosa TaxID=91324 RepID=A0A7S4DMS3_9EUKA
MRDGAYPCEIFVLEILAAVGALVHLVFFYDTTPLYILEKILVLRVLGAILELICNHPKFTVRHLVIGHAVLDLVESCVIKQALDCAHDPSLSVLYATDFYDRMVLWQDFAYKIVSIRFIVSFDLQCLDTATLKTVAATIMCRESLGRNLFMSKPRWMNMPMVPGVTPAWIGMRWWPLLIDTGMSTMVLFVILSARRARAEKDTAVKRTFDMLYHSMKNTFAAISAKAWVAALDTENDPKFSYEFIRVAQMANLGVVLCNSKNTAVRILAEMYKPKRDPLQCHAILASLECITRRARALEDRQKESLVAFGDEFALLVILENAINNARTHGHSSKPIFLDLYKEGAFVVFQIANFLLPGTFIEDHIFCIAPDEADLDFERAEVQTAIQSQPPVFVLYVCEMAMMYACTRFIQYDMHRGTTVLKTALPKR